MHCEKCSGRMSYEGFYGSDSGAVWYYPGWRCVHCGDVVDSVVTLNRRLNGALSMNGNIGKGGRVRNKKKSSVDFDLNTYNEDSECVSASSVSALEDDWS